MTNRTRTARVTAAACVLLSAGVLGACTADDEQPVVPTATGAATDTDMWWNDAVFYEVFVRSFADGDGDGTGDLCPANRACRARACTTLASLESP